MNVSSTAALAWLAAFALWPAMAAAESPGANAHPLTAEDAGAWLDGLMPTALNTAKVPGAVVVIVKDGRVLLERGYGFADYERGIAVDPHATLFRPGSTSKLFTWTAVMQLVEQGKLDLDADVNQYLDFNIPKFHGIPVTLREIMTHRAGFEETAKDLINFGETAPVLADVLKRYVPPRILEPSEGPGYSNYACALAGYIVQRVSGEAFEEYIERHIFTPLEMKNSTFRQPLPASMRSSMSKGYDTWDQVGGGFEIVVVAPAGSLSATADDMSHFMIAHLQLGRYGDGQILRAETAQLMQTTITKAFPDLDGNALGFYQQNINGHRVIAHGGDTVYFHSDLTLFPDDHVGMFVSVNAKGKDGLGEFLRQSVFEQFADRYFPAPPSTARMDVATAKAHAAMIAGSYINTRRADSSFLSLLKLIGKTEVTSSEDGSISAAPAGEEETFFEVKPFLWQQRNGHDRIEALLKDGKVVRWSSDSSAPIAVYLKPGGFAGTGLEMPLAAAAMGLLGLTAIIWPVAALVRRHYRQKFPYTGRRALLLRLLKVCALLALIAIGLWLMVVTKVSAASATGVLATLRAAQGVSLLAFIGGTALALWNLKFAFEAQGWMARLYAIALTAAFAVMAWISIAYHLIGFSAQY